MRRRLVWLVVAALWLCALALAGCVAFRSVAGEAILPVPRIAVPSGARTIPRPSDQVALTESEHGLGLLRVVIRWPIRTQLIPSDTNAITLEVKDSASQRLAYGEFARPQGAATSSATMSLDAGGNLTVQVYAYRETPPVPAGASPTAQGAKAGVEIVGGQMTDLVIVLDTLSAPSIASFSTNVGSVGDSVTIYGANLAPTQPDGRVSTPSVTFAGVAATEVTPVATGEVRVKVPAGAACGDVVATVGNQTMANPATFYVTEGVTIQLGVGATDSLNPAAATDSVVILDDSTKSFAADAGFVFPAGSSSADFPNLPAVQWRQSAGRDVGLMGQDGVFIASKSLPPGIADTTVTAAVATKVSNAMVVKVRIIMVSLTLSTASINVPAPEGQTSAGYPATASLITYVVLTGEVLLDWSSSDVATATVTESGLVTAKAKGTVTITVRSRTDPRKLATASMEVRDKGIVDITVN